MCAGAELGLVNRIFLVQKIILQALQHNNRPILLVRKVQATIKDSIFQLAGDDLTMMGIEHLCETSYHKLIINFPNGSRIYVAIR